MTELFLSMVNRSYSALWVILAVVLLRLLFRKAPTWVHAALWGLVAVRLLLPVSAGSPLSLQPSAQVIDPQILQHNTASIHTGMAYLNHAVNLVLAEQPKPVFDNWLMVLSVVWLIGMVLMLLYMIVSTLRLRKAVSEAHPIADGVYQGESVPMPFVLGFFRPCIYLPNVLEEPDLEHIIAHEKAHIRRRDHWWKPLGYILLTVHWFNPAMWLAYVLLCRDIELACDEKVIGDLEVPLRADYSETILRCSIHRRQLSACPVAFGEADVKTRIRHVLSYKKPAFWLLLLALLAGIAAAFFLWTDPVEQSEVTVWVDYLDNPSDMDYDETLHTTVHGIELAYTPLSVIRTDTGETLIDGMPIWNVFLTDLTADGCPEVCATVSFGSGIIDNHVLIADLQTGEQYTLWERGEYDYSLRLEDGVLLCEKREYPHGNLMECGPLGLVSGSFRPWIPAIGDYGMKPTTANLKGVFDSYLYLELDGETYRYEQSRIDTGSVKRGELLTAFTEHAQPNDVQWRIYAIEGIDDHREVLAVTDEHTVFSYVYSPSKAADPRALQDAKELDHVVLENGEPTHGQDRWHEFYDMTQKHRAASVTIAAYYTLDPANCDERYYEAYKEDYPALYLLHLSYDGEQYTLRWEENGQELVRQYEYLMRYETQMGSTYSKDAPKTVIRYVLTHDNNVSWDDLWQGMISSQFGAYIDHHTIYRE